MRRNPFIPPVIGEITAATCNFSHLSEPDLVSTYQKYLSKTDADSQKIKADILRELAVRHQKQSDLNRAEQLLPNT